MTNQPGNLHIYNIHDMVKIDIKTSRTFKFLIIIGIIILIDALINMTSIFNRSIEILVLKIFGFKINNLNIYTSLYASIAILLSSNLEIIKKLKYSVGLSITYIIIFTFITGYRILYPNYSLFLTLIVFITMTLPILLWLLTNEQNCEQKDIKKYGKRRKR